MSPTPDIAIRGNFASARAPATGPGFASLTGGTGTRLHSIDLSNGRATDLGALPAGVSGLTVGQTAVK